MLKYRIKVKNDYGKWIDYDGKMYDTLREAQKVIIDKKLYFIDSDKLCLFVFDYSSGRRKRIGKYNKEHLNGTLQEV